MQIVNHHRLHACFFEQGLGSLLSAYELGHIYAINARQRIDEPISDGLCLCFA